MDGIDTIAASALCHLERVVKDRQAAEIRILAGLVTREHEIGNHVVARRDER
jgi:hypothetical protein